MDVFKNIKELFIKIINKKLHIPISLKTLCDKITN